MSNVYEISKDSVKEVLDKFNGCHENIAGIIVITLNKDGTQFLSSSNMTMEEKSFLKCFFDSYVMRWFYHVEDYTK